MSEYQLYEWQTIDRPLTDQEQDAVRKLSSHITVSYSSATVDYSWGNFKHDPQEVLVRYFDACLYQANWGSKLLLFRFPSHALDHRSLQPYLVEPYIDLHSSGDHSVLSIQLNDEEGSAWIEGEGRLAALVPLRNDILRGDYRTLYLAWLGALDVDYADEIAEDEPEPPVPAGLKELTASLQAFVDLFQVDLSLIDVAAETSSARMPDPDSNLAAHLGGLTRAECEDFLMRLLRDEPLLSVALRRRLQEFAETPANRPAVPSSVAPRTVGALLDARDQRVEQARARREEAERLHRLQEMESLAAKEPLIWKEVERLLEGYQSSAYDEAVRLLVQLQEVAQHKQTQPAFQKRLAALLEPLQRRSSLMARLRHSGLV